MKGRRAAGRDESSPVSFTAHNIRLDDGEYTKPEIGYEMTQHPWFISARRVLSLAFPGDRTRHSVLDLGCLEGGYTVEFARMGFRALGIEVRESTTTGVCSWA